MPYYEGPEGSDIKLAQSNAILRFIAEKAGTNGDTPKDRAMSEMLIEESVDLYNSLVKANYSADKAQGEWVVSYLPFCVCALSKFSDLFIENPYRVHDFNVDDCGSWC